MLPGPATDPAGCYQPLALPDPACLLTQPSLQQILPLKETCGEFLFELLTARNCLDLLLELTEKYACTRARRMLSQQMAQNFEALLEEGALWQLPCRAWQKILIQDCLAVSC